MSASLLQAGLVLNLFVRTADENYVTARWCSMNGLDADFLWQSVHALEKYLKAVLLMNGRSTKKRGHDICKIYQEVKVFAEPLLPVHLSKPSGRGISHWFERSPEELIRHLLNNGNAENRYGIYGYQVLGQDLHMVDHMVFAIRRLACNLDGCVIPGHETELSTHREVLAQNADFRPHMDMPLENLITGHGNTTLRHAALNLNFAFAPSDYPHQPVSAGGSSRSTAIRQCILDPLASDDQRCAAEGIKAARWFLDNVQISKCFVEKSINPAINAARVRHGLP